MHSKILAAMVGVFLLGSCATLPQVVQVSPGETAVAASPKKRFHVVSHGWHTGIVVSGRDLNAVIPSLRNELPASRFYEIGWGDSGFYQAQDVTIGLALQAIFASPGTVVHIVAFDQGPSTYFPQSRTVPVQVDSSGYTRMLKYISSSFSRDADGRIVSRGMGLYGDSRFYTGVGRYHSCNTCNKWTAKALKSAGLEIDAAITLRSAGVMKASERASCGSVKE